VEMHVRFANRHQFAINTGTDGNCAAFEWQGIHSLLNRAEISPLLRHGKRAPGAGFWWVVIERNRRWRRFGEGWNIDASTGRPATKCDAGRQFRGSAAVCALNADGFCNVLQADIMELEVSQRTGF